MLRHPDVQTFSLQARPGATQVPSQPPSTGVLPLGLGGTRDGLVYIPPSKSEDPRPLVVLLHGAGGDGASMFDLLQQPATESGCVLLMPDARKHTWDFLIDDFGPDVGFLDDALTRLFSEVRIDPTIDQIRAALDESRFPLFVSEGSSSGKIERIRHSAYLHKGLRSFRGNCDQRKPALFVFGHSLADNDTHVLKQIEKGRCSQLFVSLYGDPATDENKAVIARAELLKSRRPERVPLEVFFYDSSSAQVWG